MLARRLIPILPFLSVQSVSAVEDTIAVASQARQIEDSGADEVYWDLEPGLFGDLESLRKMIVQVAGSLSVSLLVAGANTPQQADALLDAGADKAIVSALLGVDAIKALASRWGSEAIVVDLGTCSPPTEASTAMNMVAAGAGELLVRPRIIGNEVDICPLRDIVAAAPVAVIAFGPTWTLSQVLQVLLRAQADAVVLDSEATHTPNGMTEVKRYLAAAGLAVRGSS